MGELPTLVSDLAYILIVASAVTIVFKRLHQPLVLGYIVAGFLAGPHMPYTPSISNLGSLEDWSQIGDGNKAYRIGSVRHGLHDKRGQCGGP